MVKRSENSIPGTYDDYPRMRNLLMQERSSTAIVKIYISHFLGT